MGAWAKGLVWVGLWIVQSALGADTRVALYEVTDIALTSRAYRGSICRPHVVKGQTEAPDPACHRRVSLWRLDSASVPQLTLIDESRGYQTMLATFVLDGRRCESVVAKSEMGKGMAASPLCRAYRLPKSRDERFEQYEFFGDQEGSAVELALATLATGHPLLLSWHTSARVSFRRGETVPEQIWIDEEVKGRVLLVPSSYRQRYRLDRVSE